MMEIFNKWKYACLFYFLSGMFFYANAIDKPNSAIPLTINTPYQDFLTQPGETKWYTMVNPSAGKLTVALDTSKLQNANYDLRLYRLDIAQNILVEEITSSLPTGFNEQISKITTANNIWYVGVTSASGTDSANSFNVNWAISTGVDAHEPNDSPQQASTYPYVVEAPLPVINGTHDSGNDIDWYKYTVPVGGLFKGLIAQAFDANGIKLPFGDTTCTIYDSKFNLIRTIPPYKIFSDLSLTAGVYYIKMYSPAKISDVSYSLRLVAKAPVVASRVAISSVTSEGGVQGFINYGQGNKWRVKAGIGIYGTAYNVSGTPISNAEVKVTVQPVLSSTPMTTSVLTDSNGGFLLKMMLPPAAGQYVYDNNISFHYYDIISVKFTSSGNPLSANITDFYNFAYQIFR